jgi:glycine cleavage system H protein
MKVIEGLYYSKEHEWIRVEGDRAYLGITDYAQHSLGDIVYVELPEVDDEIDAQGSVGVVESVKAASDILAPIGFTVIEINDALEDQPELINQDPYNQHLVVVELTDVSELDDLMNSSEYAEFCKE